METVLQDLHYAFRRLRKGPGFSAVAVTTLALGIGANTAIFSVVNAVLFRALPLRQPSAIVRFLGNECRVDLLRRHCLPRVAQVPGKSAVNSDLGEDMIANLTGATFRDGRARNGLVDPARFSLVLSTRVCRI